MGCVNTRLTYGPPEKDEGPFVGVRYLFFSRFSF